MHPNLHIQFCRLLVFIFLFFPFNNGVSGQNTKSDTTSIRNYLSQAMSMPYQQLDSSLLLARKALELSESAPLESKYECNSVISQLFMDGGELDSALSYALNGLELARNAGRDSLVAYAYNSLDIIYFEMEDMEKSEEYANKAMKIAEEKNLENLLVDSYISMAIIQYQKIQDTSLRVDQKQDHYQKSRQFFEKALATENLEKWDSVHVFNNLSLLEAEMGNYDIAIDYLRQVVDYYEEDRDDVLLANAYNNLGYTYFEIGEYQKGEEYLNKAWDLVKGSNLLIERSYIAESLYEFYDSIGNYEKALHYYREYNQAEEKLNSKETSNSIALMESDYQNRILAAENEKRTNQIRNQYILIIAGLILLILLIAILLISYFSRQKQEKLLDEIKRKNEKLEELNNFKDKILSIVSHDFKSPLSNLQTTIALSQEDGLERDEYRTILLGIDDQLTQTQVFLQNILLWAKKQITGYSVDKSTFHFDEVVDTSIEMLGQQIKEKALKIKKDYKPSTTLYSDSEIVSIVFRNIFQNAIKFSRERETVVIKVRTEPGQKVISIIDSGKGMQKETIDSLFTKNIESTGGTQLEKGSGIGLLLSRDLLNMIDADIKVYSVVNQGSEFQIILPGA